MEKVKRILLIDDNDADNEFHIFIIGRISEAIEVNALEGSRQALAYFTNCFANGGKDGFPVPDLVFLDINMPAINGFELLDKIRLLPDPHNCKARMKIFMLTGSVNPDDLALATNMYSDLISEFQVKPMTKPVLITLMEKHFS